jgi:hypothetical protein
MELKKKIIEEVNSISDEAILTDIYQLLQHEQTGEYKLSEEENSAVQDGIEDIKQGRVFSSKEANSIMRHVDVQSLVRIQRVVQEERPIIRTIYPDEITHDTTISPTQLLAQFEQARAKTITYLQNLGAGQWQRHATFDSGEDTTIRTLVQILIEHDTQHLNQLIEIKEMASNLHPGHL